MLVPHPHLKFAADTETMSFPPVWGKLLSSRLGLAHEVDKNLYTWKALIDGMPILLTREVGTYFEYWRLTCQPSQVEQISESLNAEVNNGMIITQERIV